MSAKTDTINDAYKRMLQNGIEKINDSRLSEKNKKILQDFILHNKAQGNVKYKRLTKLVGMVRILAEWAGKDLDQLTKQDVTRIIGEKLEDSGYAEWTKWSYKKILKKMLKFLGKAELYTEKISQGNGDRIKIDEVLGEGDIKKLIEHAPGIRDKAIIATFWDVGMRCEELQRMKVKHFKREKSPYMLVPGVKDSPDLRQVPVADSVPYVVRWLSMHPDPKPDSPLFCSLSTRNRAGILTAQALRKILSESKENAGITKPCFLHAIRHARATFLGNIYTESQMMAQFGWKSVRMAKEYCHTSAKDLENAFLKSRGICVKCAEEESLPKSEYCEKCIVTMKDVDKSKMIPIKCPVCKELNTNTAKICDNCGLGLDPKTRMEYEKAAKDNVSLRKEMEEMKKDMLKLMDYIKNQSG